MIQCKECSADVSSDALKCPHCGTQLRKAKRGIFGFILKWVFIIFNGLMAWVLVRGITVTSQALNSVETDTMTVEQAGTILGAGIGVPIIIVIWVVGAVFLGIFVLLTRPRE